MFFATYGRLSAKPCFSTRSKCFVLHTIKCFGPAQDPVLVDSLHSVSLRRFNSTEHHIIAKEELLSKLQNLCPSEKEIKHIH